MNTHPNLLFISESIHSLPKVKINDWKQWILTLQSKWEILLYVKYHNKLEKKTHEIDGTIHSNELGGFKNTIIEKTNFWSLLVNVIKSKMIVINGIHYGFLVWLIHIFTHKKVIVIAGDFKWRDVKKNSIFKKTDQILEYLTFYHAHSIVVSNEILQKYIALKYKKRTFYLPNGADYINFTPFQSTDLIKYPFLNSEFYLSISVEVPCLQNELLLNAFAQMPSKKLVFVHDWVDENKEQNIIKRYKSCTNIHFVLMPSNNTILEKIKSNTIGYIHSSKKSEHEDDLIQSMYLKIPCYVYNNMHNKNITNRIPPYFKSEKELVTLIENGIPNYDTQLLFEYANKKHTWIAIGKKLLEILDITLTAKKQKSIRSYISILPKKELVSKQLGHLKQPRMFYE